MQPWLLIAAALQAASGAQSGAQMRGLEPVEIGHLASARSLDFRLKQDSHVPGPVPLTRGMLFQHGIAPNATVGIGLSNLYDRRKAGFDTGEGARPKRSRKPAVTFVLKF
jgi:hypothetical protein